MLNEIGDIEVPEELIKSFCGMMNITGIRLMDSINDLIVIVRAKRKTTGEEVHLLCTHWSPAGHNKHGFTPIAVMLPSETEWQNEFTIEQNAGFIKNSPIELESLGEEEITFGWYDPMKDTYTFNTMDIIG